MKFFENIKNYVAEHRRNVIIYSAICIVTLAMAIALIIWASGSAALDEIFYENATVKFSDGMRREYLVNEELPAENLSLELESGTVIAGTDCTLEADFSSAGIKQVSLSWQDGNTVYTGSFSVTVFGVRHISIEQYPTDYWIDISGNPVLGTPGAVETPEENEDESNAAEGETSEGDQEAGTDAEEETEEATPAGGLVVWAELTGEPTEFAFPEEHPDWTTTIVLTPELYDITSVQTNEGYAFEISCGNVKDAFAMVSIGAEKRCLPLQSLDSVVTFDNVNSGAETLTLYIEQSERNFEDGASEASMAKGTYVYTAANGGTYVYTFRYTLSGWSSNFMASALNNGQITDGVDDAAWGGDMRVTVNGVLFRGARAAWHLAVLDNRA